MVASVLISSLVLDILESFQCLMPQNAINISALVHPYFNNGVGTSQNYEITHIM